MMKNNWDLIRSVHSDKTGIPPQVVDYVAVEKILQLCVSGLSNKTISESLDMELEYINDVLLYFLDFSGWKKDLDVNPFLLFEKDNLSEFIDTLSRKISMEEVKKALVICLTYNRIKELINEFYD